jgi:hypothetical protein
MTRRRRRCRGSRRGWTKEDGAKGWRRKRTRNRKKRRRRRREPTALCHPSHGWIWRMRRSHQVVMRP